MGKRRHRRGRGAGPAPKLLSLSEYRFRARKRLLVLCTSAFVIVFSAGMLIPRVGPEFIGFADDGLTRALAYLGSEQAVGSDVTVSGGDRTAAESEAVRVDDGEVLEGHSGEDRSRAAEAEDTPATLPRDRFTCTVTGVHDGDGPIYCAEGPKIRLTAIAARELDETCRPGHPCPDAPGAAAQAELQRLAWGKVLTCEATGTSYRRTTAWCWAPDGTELNCAMVQGGYALHWARFDPEGKLCG
jgi:endonuclease YncB( thermonuclease family)